MTEAKIQSELFKWFWNEYPQYRGLLYHNFNNPRNKIQGAKLKAMGLLAGVPDMILAKPVNGYGALYIELKAEGEKPKVHQLQQMETLRKAQNCVHWCDSLERAKEIILNYLGHDQE